MANSVIPYQNPINVVNGAIKSVTVSKEASAANYVSSGINADSNIIIAAYESANVAGAVINLGRSGRYVFAYAFSSTGSPYTGALTITFYYIPIA